MFNEIISAIYEANNIAIVYHVNADGDAVGSSLALAFALRQLNKHVTVFGEEEIVNQLKFLYDTQNIVIFNDTTDDMKSFDLCITVDCGGINRLGKRISIFENARRTINIDHHKSNDVNADINYVDTCVSASGEIVFDLIKSLNINIDKNMAECLYTAIATDSGNFKFSNTSSKTHKIAADLIEVGIEPGSISKKLYDNVPFSKLKLLGRIIDTIEMYSNGKVSMLYVSLDMINQVDGNADEVDNIANYGLSIENVELSLFLKEVSDSRTKVSFRSKNYFDCSEFARQFGGGGHVRASGCEIEMNLDDAKKLLLEKLTDVL